MRCFVHNDREAVGTCAACFRAVCIDCAHADGRMLACKGRCEQEVRRLADLRDFSFAQPAKQREVLTQAARIRLVTGLFTLLLGVVFCIVAILQQRMRIMLALGGLMTCMGFLMVLFNRSRSQPDQFRLCANCGYNVTGNTTGRCPECNHFV